MLPPENKVTPNKRTLLVLASSTLLLAACDLPFLADEEAKIDARREAEGKAIGSACRHAGRALEECFERSPKTSKAAMFAGWRDMDGYMRENNIQVVSPDVPEPPAKQGETTEEKPKAAEATSKKKTVEAPKEAPVKQGMTVPSRGKLPNHIV